MHLSTVVLPAPFGPTKAIAFPAARVNVRPSITGRSPYLCWSPVTASRGAAFLLTGCCSLLPDQRQPVADAEHDHVDAVVLRDVRVELLAVRRAVGVDHPSAGQRVVEQQQPVRTDQWQQGLEVLDVPA